MSAPFVGQRVEVIGTSRDDLNGKKGMALAFDEDRGRYRVSLHGSDMWLKPANLLMAKEAGGMPKSMDEAREMAEELAGEYGAKLKDVLPDGFAPRDAGLAAAGFLLLWRTAGLPRAVAITAVAGAAILGRAADAFRAADGGAPKRARAALDAAGAYAAARASTRLRRPVTPRQAQIGLLALVALAFALGGRRAPPLPPFADYAPPPSSDRAPLGRPSRSAAYNLGWEDAKNGETFGHSLKADEEDDGGVPERRGPPPPPPSGFGAGAASKLMSVGMLGKTLYDLGGWPWNKDVALANFNAMPPYKKAFNAFFLARLVGLSPF